MRSVVLKSSVRCPRCQLPLRWCVCAAHQEVASPLQVDVLVHHRERHRPSSTGNLIHRVVTGSRHHEWRRERQLAAADIRVGHRELWILHPHGESAPADALPENVQLVLLDGSWREAAAMAQEVRGWGRSVSLPMAGESRYWLRSQADGHRFSTAEALMFLFERFHLRSAHENLRLQFELHVYASLRARGQKASALEFLATSPIAGIFAELIAQLDMRRRR
ncbi:MAG: tRNA-uridine aminocarboxypropyltransferase [Opitutaceae bacterium]